MYLKGLDKMKRTLVCMLAGILACTMMTACAADSKPSVETEAETTTDTTAQTQETERKQGTIVKEVITSEYLAANVLEFSAERNIYIYLPPSYDEGEKNYPVVYFLHGLGDDARGFAETQKNNLDNAFQDSDNEFILVALDGNIPSGGSFYANSPVLGNWEGFIAEEVVSYMDENYRTLAKSGSRSISGYSMGGYGAINLALTRPDVFGSVIVFAPGIYADGDIESLWDSWAGHNGYKRTYAQAFAPNLEDTENYGYIPKFSHTSEDDAIVAMWDNGYGNWSEKLDKYSEGDVFLRGIQINYGQDDTFTWIPNGCIYLSKILNEKGYENELNCFMGGHSVPFDAVKNYYIPFCDKYLEFE